MASNNNKHAPQFICPRRKYTNNLPISQLSCPVKFLNLPFQNMERYAKCGITKLEEEFKYEVWPEEILKHCPPLVDLNIFKRDPNAVMNEKDAYLLEDDFAVQTNSKRSQQHRKIVPWMRKTDYFSAEFNRYGVNSDRIENKVGYSIKKKMGNKENYLYKDKASQIDAIKKIFDETSLPIKKHYSKPDVFAVEEISLLPDEDLSKFSYAQVIFDADPMPSVKDSQSLQERTILKGMKDQDGNNFVAYFVPTEETLQKKLAEEAEGIDYTPGFEYKYSCGREYSWTVHTKQSHGPDVEAYFFTQRDGVMRYCEVDTRVKLNRRTKSSNTSRNSILSLTHRDYNEDELKGMERRWNNKFYDPWITGEYIPLEEEEEFDESVEQDEEDAEKEKVEEQQNNSDNSSSSSAEEDGNLGEKPKSDSGENKSSSSSDDSLSD